MSKKKLFKLGVISIFAFFIIYIGFFFSPLEKKDVKLSFDITLNGENNNIVQVFYMEAGDEDFTAEKVETYQVVPGKSSNIVLGLDDKIQAIRIDLGSAVGVCSVENIKFSMGIFDTVWTEEEWNSMKYSNGITKSEFVDGKWNISCETTDPYIIWDLETFSLDNRLDYIISTFNIVVRILLTIILVFVFMILIKKFEFFVEFPTEIWRSRGILLQLAKNDFRTRFAGSYLGIVWAFIQPVVTVFVYWFVFEKGLRSGAVLNVPFVLWLIAGIIPWFFFSDALSAGTNALLEYQYLVKKVVFQISVLPLVKVISNFFVHLAFIVFSVILFMAYGFYPDIYYLQIIYYSICTLVLVLGICYATSALVGFFRDLSQIVGIFLQVGIWMTPIMWNMDTMNIPEILKVFLKANPMYYIVTGYRDAFINKVWFWENMGLTVYFWVVAIIILGGGMIVFKRLKPHFADVL